MIRKGQRGLRFAVCVRNKGYEVSLERNKIYALVPDAEAERDGDVRVVDESGEDYLYSADWFVPIRIPEAVELSVRRTRKSSNPRPHTTGSARC